MTMTWQPIETAPKDGTDILVLLHPQIAERAGYHMEICHYEKRPLLGETWTAQNDGFSTELDGATHWMALPEAPNAELTGATHSGASRERSERG